MRVAVITDYFPYKYLYDYVFVENTVKAMTDAGAEVDVIVPFSLTKCILRKRPLMKYHEQRMTEKGNIYDTYWPKYVSVGNSPCLHSIADLSLRYAISYAIDKLPHKPDIIYAKFYKEGWYAFKYAKKHDVPMVIDNGECSLSPLDWHNYKDFDAFKSTIAGVVSNSSKAKEESIKWNLITEEQCVVVPNGVNPYVFKKIDKLQARRDLGYNEKDFIVAYTGWFYERKGYNRVAEAITRLDSLNIKSIFIGKTAEKGTKPSCEGILHCGPVANKEMYKYLNAADVFVLPTTNEGCCNALIEALACGLPIISSNQRFNDDILADDYSIRIDPMDVDAITKAIKWMYENPIERDKMSSIAYEASKGLSLEVRGERIVRYLETLINKKSVQ